MATTDLATIQPGGFLALTHSTGEIQAIIGDNLAGQDVGEFDLPRVTMPAGGGTRWEIPGLAGTESSETLTGILVYTRQTRAYWPSKDVTGDPPQCASRDGQVGIGDPGGECRTCPHAQFGSDGQRGQACKQQSQWFLLRADSFLPVVLGLPPTSLKAAKQYMLALAGAGIRYFEVVTDIGLERDQNLDGQPSRGSVAALTRTRPLARASTRTSCDRSSTRSPPSTRQPARRPHRRRWRRRRRRRSCPVAPPTSCTSSHDRSPRRGPRRAPGPRTAPRRPGRRARRRRPRRRAADQD
jgi:hypothetical protein